MLLVCFRNRRTNARGSRSSTGSSPETFSGRFSRGNINNTNPRAGGINSSNNAGNNGHHSHRSQPIKLCVKFTKRDTPSLSSGSSGHNGQSAQNQIGKNLKLANIHFDRTIDNDIHIVSELMEEGGSPDHRLSPTCQNSQSPRLSRARASSYSMVRLRRSNSPVCRRRENRLTRISLCIVWLFLFCHIWKIIPTVYELMYGSIEKWPQWLLVIQDVSHALIVLNSSINFLIYVAL